MDGREVSCTPGMTRIAIEGVTRRFGPTVAVDGVNLAISAGELFFVLGPSGCGKTTLLRILAGFVRPDAGRISFGDRDVTSLGANKRDAAMVFQSYALWPHMTVLENVSYGLRVRRVPSAERRDRAMAALRAARLDTLSQRKPAELSGGEQQRVALARALVVEPQVLLLDEPLSNLDAALRHEMRLEIRRICRQTKITTVYVTHDRAEALSMADTLAVMRSGRIAQVGSPREVYLRPASRFVAGFLGETNLLDATIVETGKDLTVLDTPAGRLTSSGLPPAGAKTGSRVTCSIRPEALRVVIQGHEKPPNTFAGRKRDTVYLGATARHQVELDDGTPLKVLAIHPRGEHGGEDDRIHLTVDAQDVVILKN